MLSEVDLSDTIRLLKDLGIHRQALHKTIKGTSGPTEHSQEERPQLGPETLGAHSKGPSACGGSVLAVGVLSCKGRNTTWHESTEVMVRPWHPLVVVYICWWFPTCHQANADELQTNTRDIHHLVLCSKNKKWKEEHENRDVTWWTTWRNTRSSKHPPPPPVFSTFQTLLTLYYLELYLTCACPKPAPLSLKSLNPNHNRTGRLLPFQFASYPFNFTFISCLDTGPIFSAFFFVPPLSHKTIIYLTLPLPPARCLTPQGFLRLYLSFHSYFI